MSASRILPRPQSLRQVNARALRAPHRCLSCTARHAQQQNASQQSSSEKDKTTHFGFETIPEYLKESKVRGVFSSVAQSYDTMNDLMSLGIHRLWKDHFVRSMNPGTNPLQVPQAKGWNILDIAGGTGDIAFRLLDHASTVNNDPHTRVTVADINPEMLAEGKKRSLSTPYARTGRLAFVEANAEHLDMIPDASIDLYTVAFGIRNFTDKDRALREAFRVLRPGGVFACLEFSKVNNPVFNTVYKNWSFSAIPLIGQLVAGDRDSYQYLVESIEKFPSQEEFSQMIKNAGFVVPGKGWEDLTLGISAIHKGVKPLQ
ncbi:ubiE/COQ5 methyltransferase family-domain-containing protein [Phyllosticta citrichinensis]|uniref:2-methoxy-6-polyprenyl-1,4-benzoquinol methylase, mitochondrial n=1 Tax=Phyllosticta citrichinensis TaxID=1130410 RepID=A0ABR1XFN8_9PEZI